MTDHKVFYTASIVRYDGSDTTSCGEPCEPGHGYTEEDGWLDPDWSSDTVYENQEDVRPDEYDSEQYDENDSPAEWLAETLWRRIGACDSDEYSGDGRWRQAEAYEHPYGTHSIRITADAYGFTDAELAETNEILNRRWQEIRAMQAAL